MHESSTTLLRPGQASHSITRKLLLGAGAVVALLVLSTVGGLYGLDRFRRVVHELEYSINEAPHQEDLVRAVSYLIDPVFECVTPVQGDSPSQSAGPPNNLQRVYFDSALSQCRQELDEFDRKLQQHIAQSPANPKFEIVREMRRKLGDDLQLLEQAHARSSESEASNIESRTMHRLVSGLLRTAQSVPDPVEGVKVTLKQSRKDYGFAIVVTTTLAGIALVIVGWLFWYIRSAVYLPLTELHTGVKQVAGGDLDHRIPITSNDEMADVALSFNQMTQRFQETREDLDRQVTERSQQLVRSERLANVGVLAAGVAHEINNPLSAICMAAEALEGRIEPLLANDDPSEAAVVRKYLAMMQSESFRCREITDGLLNFARGKDDVREMIDLVTVVNEVLAMISHLPKHREKTIEFRPESECVVEVNAAEIKQVVLNLVSNGLEAMEPGGRLSIRLIQRTDLVLLEFRDEGCGMTPEVQSQVFEPFFTQRQDGQGTGLGLSISHRIVQQHRGTICAKSEGPGCGSTFTVSLPRRAEQRAAA